MGAAPKLLRLWLLLVQSLQDVHEEASGKTGRREHVCFLQCLKCTGKYRNASVNTDIGHSLQFSNLKYHCEETAKRNDQSISLIRDTTCPSTAWQCFGGCQALHSKCPSGGGRKTCCSGRAGSCPPIHTGCTSSLNNTAMGVL